MAAHELNWAWWLVIEPARARPVDSLADAVAAAVSPDAGVLEVADIDELAGRVDANAVGVVVDLSGASDPSAFMQAIRAVAPALPVVAVVDAGSEALGLRALRLGADDAISRAGLDPSSLARVLHDALERRGTAHERSARPFRHLIERSPIAAAMMSRDGFAEWVSPAAAKILGHSPEEMIGRPMYAFVHPSEAGALHAESPAVVAAPGLVTSREFRARHRDGSWRWVESTSTNLLDDPSVGAFVVNFRDITDRKRSEANFRLLIEHMPVAVFVQCEGEIVYANPAVIRLLRYDRVEELVGRPSFVLIHPDEQERVRARRQYLLQHVHAPADERRLLARDGSTVHVETEAIAIAFNGKPAAMVMARDLTERREMLARLALTDRMATVGTLAAGVAHEINNPLAFLLSNLRVLERALVPLRSQDENVAASHEVDTTSKLLHDAIEGAERVQAVVRDLRALSRVDDEQKGPVDVHAVLRSSLKIVGNEIRHRARLVEEYAPVPSVHANEARLGQVFLNLLINAAQSIPDGSADRNTIRVRTHAPEPDRIVVEVHDTGVGIPNEQLARIFDPFFTTKPVGVGTGLGLSICHGVVKSLGGEIQVDSRVGVGTVFRVLLPAVRATAVIPARTTPSSAPPAPVTRARRLLVVDDEPLMGQSLQFLLSPEHEVESVTRARHALHRLGDGERFDAILCDLMMPEMNGMDFHAEVARLAPELAERIVFLTGGAFTSSAQSFLKRVPNPVLEKPFDEGTLRATLRRVLHE